MRCAVGCGHVQRGVDVGYGLDTVRGDAAHPVNRGLACQRGVEETADPSGEWLTQPLVRRGGELKKTTWDVALARIVEEFGETLERDRVGVAVLGSGQQTNEAAYALGKLARGGFGTRYYDANTTLCMASAVNVYYDAFGSDAPPCTYDDIPDAESHVVWGANPRVAHPVMFRWISDSADDPDSELIVVDPVESETAETADTHVSPDLGGDLDLARAVLAHVVETGRVDEAFVAESTSGFDDLVAGLPDPEAAADRAGVPFDAVEKLADALDDPTLIYWGMGVNQSVQGTDTAGALVDCCLATGNVGPGSGPFSLTGQSNSMGTRVCSSKGGWPGQRDFDDPESRELVAEEWGVPVDRLPDDTGPGPVGTVAAIADGPIEAVYAPARARRRSARHDRQPRRGLRRAARGGPDIPPVGRRHRPRDHRRTRRTGRGRGVRGPVSRRREAVVVPLRRRREPRPDRRQRRTDFGGRLTIAGDTQRHERIDGERPPANAVSDRGENARRGESSGHGSLAAFDVASELFPTGDARSA